MREEDTILLKNKIKALVEICQGFNFYISQMICKKRGKIMNNVTVSVNEAQCKLSGIQCMERLKED